MSEISLDLRTISLDGSHLVEASAGTGKTFAIAFLYLRFVLEKGFLPENILVMTFTNAATDELKERIRTRLEDAYQILSGRKKTSETLLGMYLEAFSDGFASDLACRRLLKAIQELDQPAIFTIHGFCQLVLAEFPLETNSVLNSQVNESSEKWKRQFIEDFWRKNISILPSIILARIRKVETIQSYISFINMVGKPGFFLSTPDDEKSVSDFVLEIAKSDTKQKKIFDQIFIQWKENREEISRLLLEKGVLNTNMKYSVVVKEIDEVVTGDRSIFTILEKKNKYSTLEKLTPAILFQQTNKGKITPVHLIFDLCAEVFDLEVQLKEQITYLRALLRHMLIKQMEVASSEKAIKLGHHFYDDLLFQVADAVSRSDSLVQLLQQKYKVVLIDEYQDTDSLQALIFEKLFLRRSKEEGSVFYIGDPKQSIYRFRGADISTYIRTKKEIENIHHHTLLTNYRSQKKSVDAVNFLFSQAKKPFSETADILFACVEAAKPSLEKNPGLTVFQYPSLTELPRKTAEDWSVCKTVVEIDRLLKKGKETNIGVLVFTVKQAIKIRVALEAQNIRVYSLVNQSVFQTQEARGLLWFLEAILWPSSLSACQKAMYSGLIDRGHHKIEKKITEEIQERFLMYHIKWEQKGLMSLLREVEVAEKWRKRNKHFLSRIENLQHLMERLAYIEAVRNMTPLQTYKWLQMKVEQDSEGEILLADQLRCPQKEKELGVTLVTIHKAKGLEYEYVFCPFWKKGSKKSSELGNEIVYTQDPEKGGMRVSLFADAKTVQKSKQEEEEEYIRLLYVLLTRARKQTFLGWQFEEQERKEVPFDNLLHKIDDKPTQEIISEIARTSNGTIVLEQINEKSKLPPPLQEENSKDPLLSKKHFISVIDTSFRMASFTGLVHTLDEKIGQEKELMDYGYNTSQADEEESGNDVATFPKGTFAGLFFHDVFEGIDFTKTKEISGVVRKKLVNYRFSDIFFPAIHQCVKDVIQTPLKISKAPSFSLQEISVQNRVNEMSFCFPLDPNRLSSVKLQEAICQLLLEMGESTSHWVMPSAGIKGFMKGSIDLVVMRSGKYYLIDYKSNWLGHSKKDYTPERIQNEMRRHHYHLQYWIYLVALSRYLKTRLPDFSYEEHIGGVFYLFVRGMNPENGKNSGVFAVKPSHKALGAFAQSLLGEPLLRRKGK